MSESQASINLVRQIRTSLESSLAELDEGKLTNAVARRIFTDAETCALAFLERHTLENFFNSVHYQYVLELKAKEGIVPKLQDFQVPSMSALVGVRCGENVGRFRACVPTM